jgi:hypothetical protein
MLRHIHHNHIAFNFAPARLGNLLQNLRHIALHQPAIAVIGLNARQTAQSGIPLTPALIHAAEIVGGFATAMDAKQRSPAPPRPVSLLNREIIVPRGGAGVAGRL